MDEHAVLELSLQDSFLVTDGELHPGDALPLKRHAWPDAVRRGRESLLCGMVSGTPTGLCDEERLPLTLCGPVTGT